MVRWFVPFRISLGLRPWARVPGLYGQAPRWTRSPNGQYPR